MKAPGAQTNTHAMTVPGFHARLRKDFEMTSPVKGFVTIRVTSDEFGETISLQGNGFLVGCKVKDVEAVVKTAREERT